MASSLDAFYNELLEIYTGSDGERTKALYSRLEKLGPAGFVGANLFRAQKNSERAKKYRGGIRGEGSFRGMAYDRKEWALNNLQASLKAHANDLRIVWGWGEDPAQEYHRAVLYVELPTGQVSFHCQKMGDGPLFPHQWDGVRGVGQTRICRWIANLMLMNLGK